MCLVAVTSRLKMAEDEDVVLSVRIDRMDITDTKVII